MANHRSETLTTKQIGEFLVQAFPDFNLGSNLPNDHSDKGNKGACWCAGSNQRIFKKVEGKDGLYQVVTDRLIADDIKEIENSSEIETTKQALIEARIGQGRFRQLLIGYWKKCAVTNVDLIPILKASHIKPWAQSSNDERLDTYNGLLLSPILDALFDQGYISFENDGSIIISKSIFPNLKSLGVSVEMKIHGLQEKHFRYLEFHRENIYLG